MEPETFGLSDIRNAAQLINSTCIHRTGCPDDGERNQTRGPVSRDGRLERQKVHLERIVHRHFAQCRSPKTQNIQRAGVASVRLCGAVGDKLRAIDSSLSRRKTKRRVPCHLQGNNCRHGCASNHQAARRLRKAKLLSDPVRQRTLHPQANMVAAAAIRVDRGVNHGRQHTKRRAATMHPAEKARVRISNPIRQ